ncbi:MULTISPECIES: bifunctional methylenetetrahydrofolate dehydrogenase/methenyltetrahydrofolate cyclohydrolase [unclassified Streptococcus]|uniref:bifunctional methylenetetrahydrofolate dehydrogenase/methenyltetrahydrofolate cyclohydrolase n=1 Tax=unclassified Streptococcus TaxID=2608887 RepID=UPI0010728B64|nr:MULTISPECIES: bifunctional methylenetetrahydrofolate dehydrogenase/methenyltetrahydrofolate cyclohydrolase [unclassified Streptococcus]MBF0806210.1 bifunctional methylenetetrahydrofolate dehydrogenase/methenyltetrahydrofolate cyclohydrolase [Streptococcus sp. 19428wA2_WM07]TFU28194.1 bifunctional methylenetetrahydrofolate dehydrogenase/methenyltetrahydrofolate cyclohydrolase [Streptococcus sp. WM07]
MQLLDGKALALKKRAALAEKTAQLLAEEGLKPCLVVVLVGENPASQVYVRNKEKAAIAAGFESRVLRYPDSLTEEELLELLAELNQDTGVHGILVQLPLPSQIREDLVLEAIDPAKDVDGFHPFNVGRLWTGDPLRVPSTPAGIMALLAEYGINPAGKKAVVIGRSNIVGKPMAEMLLAADATVTIAHSKTENLAQLASEADILVVAIGRGHFVGSDFVKEGAVVIDVGMNRNAEGKLIGDVDFEAVKDKAAFLTPVPGGVGPMTIAMLLEQTFQAAVGSRN